MMSAFPSPKAGFFSRALVLTTLLLLALLAGCASYDKETPDYAPAPPPPPVEASAPSSGKIPITSLDELPPHTYPLAGSVSQMLQDEKAMDSLRKAYKTDLEADLDTYLITDATTLQGKYSSLLMFEMIDGNEKQVLDLLEKIKALEDKEAARLMNGIMGRSILKARLTLG